jgi:hypothetical protein
MVGVGKVRERGRKGKYDKNKFDRFDCDIFSIGHDPLYL